MKSIKEKAFSYKTENLIWILLIILFTIFLGTISDANDIYVGQLETFSTIQAAINAATDGDCVIVKDGTYKGAGNKNVLFNGKAITVKSETGPQNCIIDCEQDGRGFYFQNNETSASVLNGFTIINGKSKETLYGMTVGGVIYCYSSSPTIINCSMNNNNADIGGGIYCHLASPLIDNCIISGNIANYYGGGIYCYSSSSPKINNCAITNNTATNYYGGAIFCDSTSSPIINHCTISDNSAHYGGAGIHCESSSILEITNCIISRNSGNNGGGIYCESSSLPRIVNCVITSNRAENGNGGGIYCTSFSSPKIFNCTFNSNYAKSNGGGIFCTNASPVITNCILWNDAPNEIYPSSSNATITYSDIKGGYAGTKNINADPLFSNSGNGDYRLLSGSPCIDAGFEIDKLYSDQRGSLRPINANDKNEGNNFDMGALEYSNYNNDSVLKAFQEVKLTAYYGLTNYDNEIEWKSTSAFPKNDYRIFISEGNFNAYRIRVVLIGKNGRRINLEEKNSATTYPENFIQTTGLHIWSKLFQFNQTHLGEWYIRIEMADDPHQYLDSSSLIKIKESQNYSWIIGKSIAPPEYADPNKKPEISDQAESSFYWSDYAKKLYAVSPLTAIIKWKDTNDIIIPVIGTNIWPVNPQIHIARSLPVNLLPTNGNYHSVEMQYKESDSLINTTDHKFTATTEGYSVLSYWEIDEFSSEPVFEVVRTYFWDNPVILKTTTWPIGKELSDPGHNPSCGTGYVFYRMARYDTEIYNRENHSGQIFSVNKDYKNDPNDDMVVFWYQKGITGVCWPCISVRYNCQWPQNPEKIIIARQNGSGVINESLHKDWKIYIQNDANQPGFNPNNEHAMIFPYSNGRAVFALRDDLGSELTSEPYVLVKYKEPVIQLWRYRVFKVMREESPYFFREWAHLSNDPDNALYDPNTNHDPPKDPYEGTAGVLIQAPFPLTAMEYCQENQAISGPFFEDRKERHWARAAGDNGGTATITMRYYYTMQTGFYPDHAHGGTQVGAHIPWLDNGTGTPVNVTYTITWPKEVPQMKIGTTLVESKYGLPAIDGQCSVDIIYQQSIANGGGSSAIFVDPIRIRKVGLNGIPDDIIKDVQGGIVTFPQLSLALRRRICYETNPLNLDQGFLIFKGEYIQPVTGFDYTLINVMSEKERNELLALSHDSQWQTAVYALYTATKDPIRIVDCNVDVYEMLALTSGFAQGTGYVTLAMQNAGEERCPEDLPVSLEIIKVTPELDQGGLMVITPQCPFDEKLTLRYKLDFAGHPGDYEFHWKYLPDEGGTPPADALEHWYDYIIKQGAMDITIQGPGLFTLSDNWFICRYRYTGGNLPWSNQWSEWTEPQLAVGWIKRVVGDINPFTQRATGGGIEGAENSFFSYKDTEVNTVVSMISQAGPRWTGSVPLNCMNLNDFGLLEIYETVFKRGIGFSIDGLPSVHYPPANQALLLVASRIADLYMLLGNEAYADAADPTVGFDSDDPQYGSAASSIHCFENLTSSLLEEELALLRGRDSSKQPSVKTHPVYNRLIWNFTNDMTGGEVAYALNYNIQDENGDVSRQINEADAKIRYPQGHGDAWGHYLTAIKTYYRLLIHPNYTWNNRPEAILVGGSPVTVDYLDERKFAKIAAARARTGAEIVNLAYRDAYIEDPEGQWQGYKDTDHHRAWGVSEWASRAGQGVYFDWIAGNAILPDKDNDPAHTGIQKIDRSTVLELREVVGCFEDIQSQLDKVDSGLNPVGVAKDAIPFDINAKLINPSSGDPQTHFEQIYDRSVTALNNAIAIFNYANHNTQLIRRQQDTLYDFRRNVEDREADFNNRLIEIFGSPYLEDCGPTGAYPTGYEGPDLYHWAYVNTSLNPTQQYPVTVKDFTVSDQGVLNEQTRVITFHVDTKFSRFVKPKSWTIRSAPGEIQMAILDLLQTTARLEQGITNYNHLLEQIEDQAKLLRAQYNLNSEEINILNETLSQQQSLNSAILEAKDRQMDYQNKAQSATQIANALSEAYPQIMGIIGGTACGTIFDPSSAIRSAIRYAGAIVAEIFNRNAQREMMAEMEHQQAKETVQALSNLKLTSNRSDFAILQQLSQIEQLIRQESSLRLELNILQENIQQSENRYMAALAKGDRLLDDRIRFRQQTAEKIQQYRYKDMAFRIFRNDALQKYRAQFDLAAMYVYLAAKAYDYDTTLLNSHSWAGQAFLTDIIRKRAIGLIVNGQPSASNQQELDPGLADPIATLRENFQTLKSQIGFLNPQVEENRFSLRSELFRIKSDMASNTNWRSSLGKCLVENLWDVPEFRHYCDPFISEEQGKQPALVIPFETNITNGMNFFGWPLGGGDSFYPRENFATKILSVGVWFSNYNSLYLWGMSNTPRVYLVPAGTDVLGSAWSYSFDTREWQIVDQLLPLPYPIEGSTEWQTKKDWIPIVDSLNGQIFQIRRHGRFRAYHDDGYHYSEMIKDNRLIGRSVWNTRWLLIIPGISLHGDPKEGLELFINGPLNLYGERSGNGVTDIKITFETYSYSGF